MFSQNLSDLKLRIITQPNLNNILNLGEEIAPTQTEKTTRTRKFPPGTFINIDPQGLRPTSAVRDIVPTASTATRKLIVRPTTSTISRPTQIIGSVVPPAGPTISTPGKLYVICISEYYLFGVIMQSKKIE